MTLQNLPLEQKKIDELQRQIRHYNIPIIYLPNYMPHRQKHSINDYLVEVVDQAYEYFLMCDENEIENLFNSMPSPLQWRVNYKIKTEDEIKNFALYYVCSELNNHKFSFKNAINQHTENSEIFKEYPELKQKLDKDGLLHLDSNFILHDGGIEYKNHILHYHQLLRREYRNNPNFDFIGYFINYYFKTKENNQFRIAIDHSRIMPKEFYQQILELDTWYGPPFDINKLDDPNYVGLTVHQRNKNSLFEDTCSLDTTEFYWSYRDAIKTFEIEEISGDNRVFDDYYFNRYVHSERDINKKKFRHLDGAVKVYLKDDFSKRKESTMPKEFKSKTKVKLWRIDGDIDLKIWSELISQFFKGNEMIIEYFDPEKFKELFELRIRDFKQYKEQEKEKLTMNN